MKAREEVFMHIAKNYRRERERGRKQHQENPCRNMT